jgi:hypothetical protein
LQIFNIDPEYSSGNDTGNDAERLPEIVSGRKKIFFFFGKFTWPDLGEVFLII